MKIQPTVRIRMREEAMFSLTRIRTNVRYQIPRPVSYTKCKLKISIILFFMQMFLFWMTFFLSSRSAYMRSFILARIYSVSIFHADYYYYSECLLCIVRDCTSDTSHGNMQTSFFFKFVYWNRKRASVERMLAMFTVQHIRLPNDVMNVWIWMYLVFIKLQKCSRNTEQILEQIH